MKFNFNYIGVFFLLIFAIMQLTTGMISLVLTDPENVNPIAFTLFCVVGLVGFKLTMKKGCFGEQLEGFSDI